MLNPIETAQEYTQINLVSPIWLKFDPKNRRFFGTPKKTDIRNFNVKVLYSDGYNYVYQNFFINITNQKPRLKPGMQLENVKVMLGGYIQIEVPYIYEDPDEGDSVIYTAYIRNQNCTTSKCVTKLTEVEGINWLLFDSQRNYLMGNPQPVKDVSYHEAEQKYYQLYYIEIVGTDQSEASVKSTFTLELINRIPRISGQSIQEQFDQKIKSIVVNTEFEFRITKSVYVDEDNDKLYFSIKYKYKGRLQPLPTWIEFDDINLVIKGTPPSDMVLETFGI